jgi:hypothetical protein
MWAELPRPIAIPTLPPESPAPPPGRAPAGDSRSFRRWNGDTEEFCLVYRYYDQLVKRRGVVGTMGTWTVVVYPSQASAARAYANECSSLAAEGFRDVR